MSSRANARPVKRVLVVILAAALTACAGAQGPVPTGTDTAWHGNLTKGSKFGAATGQTALDAQQGMLAAGYGFEGEFACSTAMLRLPGCPAEARYLQFQPVQPGEKGHIYLQIENGVVSQIAWNLTPVAYIDN